MSESDIQIHEVTFCSRVSKWADALFAGAPSLSFTRTEIEQSKGIKKKRSDLRVYGAGGALVLAGEVKLPGTAEGRNPYNSALVEDSYQKASNAGAEYFFTWNVNKFVLFDAKQWQKPIMERRVKDYDLGLDLENPEDVSRAEVEKAVQEFLAKFFDDFEAIVAGKTPDWGMAPDEFFIRAFESHISWPVKLTAEFLWAKSASDKTFNGFLQEWMANEQGWAVVRNDPKAWRMLIDRAARTLCYVFANRLLFYESVRAKFDALTALQVPPKASSAHELYLHFQHTFQKAVDATGDYETLFYPAEKDWAGPLIFSHENSLDAWRSVLENLHPFNFKEIRTDILGGIFKRLIEPEERHKFGQHYTNEDLVDVVNAFCIRNADDNVLDPACGSGSFIVRAYHRKAWLDSDKRHSRPGVSHQDRLAQIYGADISLFAAHLSTLNLAAREINDEENYPRIARRNFFEVRAGKPFCELPQGLRGEKKRVPINLPTLNAVVGNPPYVRQELLPRRNDKPKPRPMQAKEDLLELCAELWPGLKLSGRSDLHCYFWPAATHLLTADGWFGFLVSSSWLDVDYGFALQGWVLTNFKIHAILESNAEPWFEDARVKTCAVLLQRCDDVAERNAQLVKFVRLDVPLADILGERKGENARQAAAELFRANILACKKNASHKGWRVVVKKQKDLWEDGLRAGRLFELQKQRNVTEGIKNVTALENGDEGEDDGGMDENGNGLLHDGGGMGYGPRYGGGKWGKYLRAPNLYFQIMERYGSRFVPLGEIATIRFGVKSGCDAFFMPEDVTTEILNKYSRLDWNNAPLFAHCKYSEVISGKLRLVKAGDGTVHPVETEYLKPELHSLMSIRRPLVKPSDVNSMILMVEKSKDDLKGSHVLKYLRYGETNPVITNKKADALTVSKRPTCANRIPWYNLTYTKPGQLIWAKGQQYRHLVVFNKHHLTANCRLYDLTLPKEDASCADSLAAIANSTLIAYFKTFYGRYTGTEGSFEMMVIDLNLMEVPDPRLVTKAVGKKLQDAFHQLCQRDTQPLVEEEFMECRSSERIKKLAKKPIGLPLELTMPDRRALDLAVFELLGVSDAAEREALCDELYFETAKHFRQIRVVEVQKQEQRSQSEGREFGTDEMAADLWDSLSAEDKQPLAQWVAAQSSNGAPVEIPDGTASLPDANDFLDKKTVFFRSSARGKADSQRLEMPSRAHAELVYLLAQRGVHGALLLPKTENAAQSLLVEITNRLAAAAAKAKDLSSSRTGDEKKALELARLLEFWMIHGKP